MIKNSYFIITVILAVIVFSLSCSNTKKIIKISPIEIDNVIFLKSSYAIFYTDLTDFKNELLKSQSEFRNDNKQELIDFLNELGTNQDSINILENTDPQFLEWINYTFINLTINNKTIVKEIESMSQIPKIFVETKVISTGKSVYYKTILSQPKTNQVMLTSNHNFGVVCSGI